MAWPEGLAQLAVAVLLVAVGAFGNYLVNHWTRRSERRERYLDRRFDYDLATLTRLRPAITDVRRRSVLIYQSRYPPGQRNREPLDIPMNDDPALTTQAHEENTTLSAVMDELLDEDLRELVKQFASDASAYSNAPSRWEGLNLLVQMGNSSSAALNRRAELLHRMFLDHPDAPKQKKRADPPSGADSTQGKEGEE